MSKNKLIFSKGDFVKSVHYIYQIIEIQEELKATFNRKTKESTSRIDYFYVVRNVQTEKVYPVYSEVAHKRYKICEDQKTLKVLYGNGRNPENH